MWLMIEIPDDCDQQAQKLISWYESRSLGSEGEVLSISPADDLTSRKLTARILDIQVP